MSDRRDRRLTVALVLLAIYVLTPFVPPAAMPLQSPPPDAWIGARVFPGTAWWMVGRLCCLFAGAALIGVLTSPDAMPAAFQLRARDAAGALSRGWGIAAVAAAAGLLLASFWAARFSRAMQVGHMVAGALPTLLLWLGVSRPSRQVTGALRPGPALAIAGVGLAWVAVVIGFEWHSALSADSVDNWIGLEYLERAARPGFNLLTDRLLPGVTSTYTLLQGVLWLGDASPAHRFELVQAFHTLWLLLAGIGIGGLAALCIGGWTAPIATAAFLFAPFTLLTPLTASPFFIGPLFGVALLWLLAGVHVWRSPAALVALATTIGYTLTLPPVAPLALLVLAVAAWSLWRGPPMPSLALAAAAVALLAAALPGLPDTAALQAMVGRYALLRGVGAELELVVLGQRSPINVRELWHAGRPGVLDVPLGSVLAPFGIARDPLRLWGDAVFEPLGAALAACGVAVCLRAARRRWLAAALLVLLAVGVLPAFVSSFDRPSLTRMFVAPIAIALLAAVGFDALTRVASRVGGAALAGAASAAIALGGVALFFVVAPTILAASANGIAMRALPFDAPPARAALLDYPGDEFSWLHVARTATYLPRQPIAVWALPPLGGGEPGVPPYDVVVWSPALESDRQVSDLLCRAWPDATLFTLWDRAHLSRALAARRAASDWQPALPPRQWSATPCAARTQRSP